MCIIIDNDVVARVLTRSNDSDYHDLHSCLFGSKGPNVKLVYGGTLLEEYQRNRNVIRIVVQLDRAGKAIPVPDKDIDVEQNELDRQAQYSSNDVHILALARVSGTRVLCSNDNDLIADFKNKKIIDRPRGRVYRHAGHRKLLSESCN